MSGNKLGNTQRVTLARLVKLGSCATFEQLYHTGLLGRAALRATLGTLEVRKLVTAPDEKGLIWITDAGHTAHGGLP